MSTKTKFKIKWGFCQIILAFLENLNCNRFCVFFQVLREVYASKHTIIILDCNKDMIEEVLTQAQQIGMISEDFYYLLTSLDAHTVDLHSFKVLKTGSDKMIYCLKSTRASWSKWPAKKWFSCSKRKKICKKNLFLSFDTIFWDVILGWKFVMIFNWEKNLFWTNKKFVWITFIPRYCNFIPK